MSEKSTKTNERIGLRVTAYSDMGCRRYMEDCYSVAYQKNNSGKDLEFAYFAMFDGHGGDTAAKFAKNHLMNFIVDQPGFWSEDDEDVLQAIKVGFLECHMAMWRDLDNWPPTSSGLPSTAGTTASIAFIRKGKLYIGHCGDSGIVLAKENTDSTWKAEPLTIDHKPDSDFEKERIESCGGKVIEKQGIHRVVWYRPKFPHQGPIRRNTRIEEVPFLAVARSLGDLWSYNLKTQKFMVSPEPDVSVHEINTLTDKCLIFASDGLWNIMEPSMAVNLVYEAESINEQNAKVGVKSWRNPSRYLVDVALQRWRDHRLRSDNTSVVCVMLDVPYKKNCSGMFGNMQQEHTSSRTIYDYSTSEAYNLDYMDINSYGSEEIDRHNYNLLSSPNHHQPQPFNPYHQFYTSGSSQLPPFASERGYQPFSQSSSSSSMSSIDDQSIAAELTYHTSSNESAFVKGCCPNERFMLAKANEQIHYHVSYEQHKEMYRNMAQQPLPPLHYAYRPVITQPYMLPSMNDSNFHLAPTRSMERYNYLRPTDAEVEELHKATEEDEFDEQNVIDPDDAEMEWSDDEDEEDDEDETEKETEISEKKATAKAATTNEHNEAETSGNDITSEVFDMKNSDDSIQIFEISSSNIGISGKSKNKEKSSVNEKKQNTLPETSNNKENSETPVRKRKPSKSPVKQSRYYETRQTNRKMRSGTICSGVQKTISKERHKKIARYVKKTIKTMADLKTSTSIALKKLETLSIISSSSTNNAKSAPSTSNKSNKNHNNTSSNSTATGSEKSSKKILRSSQISIKKASGKATGVMRNLRSSAVLTEKSIQRKRNSRAK